MIRKFKVITGFYMFIDLPMITKDTIIEIDTDKVHVSHINHWIRMGYMKEIKAVKIRRKNK